MPCGRDRWPSKASYIPQMSSDVRVLYLNPVRIALDPKALLCEPELVLELGHELAHIKMDPRYDNYLVETFAMAVSLRTLKALHFEQARKSDIALYTRLL